MSSRLGLLLAAGLLASACATARAAAPVERPALEVPPAPPRLVEAAPAPDIGNFEPVADLPPEKPVPPAATTKPRPSSSRDATNRDPQKPEAKPTEPLPTVVEPPPPTTPAQPPASGVLRTPATAADPAASERQIRDTMASAQKGLSNVPFSSLNGQRKKAYNECKDFIERADAALKVSNFELAKELAGKAEKLANELQRP